jgi:nitroreductase
MKTEKFIHYPFEKMSEKERLRRSTEFYNFIRKRRSIRNFSNESIDRKIIEKIISTAGTAPSGANKQPWKFIVVDNPLIKKEIREAVEKEEKRNYESRFPNEWKEDLELFGTDWHKEFIETAPFLIIVFKVDYNIVEGKIKKNYYVTESVGIAVGFLLTAIHNAGLCALTHTPSPMNFLRTILDRPKNETPFLLIPVGLPTDDAKVPNISRKPLNEIIIYNRG